MYEIMMDGKCLWYPGDSECVVSSPELHESLNDAGYIQFTVPVHNPLYNSIKERISMVQVLKDGKEIFYGVVKEISVNMRREKKVYAVGLLSFLADSIQPQKKFQNITPLEFINELVQRHNEQVEAKKQFEVGIVTVKDANDSIYRFTNYEDTLSALREKICESLDGYLRAHRNGEKNILDVVVLKDYGKTCAQKIEFGENLLDYAESTTTDDIATAVIPRGKALEESKIEGLTSYLTIESVNGGKDFVYNQSAVNHFGWIKKVVDWGDITLPENLKKKAEEWLKDKQFASLTLELNAVDLSALDAGEQSFELGDYVRAVAEPYGMDAWFPVQEKTTYLADVSKNKITLSNTSKKTYTQYQAKMANDLTKKIPSESSILQAAKDNASKLIQTATNGYIVLKMDEDGNPCELLIMDSKDIDMARRVWRWNLNGFGYSSTGYNGKYGLAITMDGAIVADFITVGTLLADRIKGGTLTLGGMDNKSGILHILNKNGQIIGKWDKDGISINAGAILADVIKGGTLTLGGINNGAGKLNILDDTGENVIGKWDKDGISINAGAILADVIKGGTLTLGGINNGAGKLNILDNTGENVIGKWDKDGISIKEGSILADVIKGGTLQGITIISEKNNHKIKLIDGEVKGYQKNNEVGSLDYSDGTTSGGVYYPAMRLRAQQSMTLKTPRLFTAETGEDTANVIKCTSGEVKVMTSASTYKSLKFMNGLLVTGL